MCRSRLRSTATIRVTTVKEASGEFVRRAAYLRLGRKGGAWVQSESAVWVAIVSEAGDLDADVYTPDWRRWPHHPDTGYVFENKRIPKFGEAVGLCLELHAKVPHFTIIGWDLALGGDDRIKLLEWNATHCGIKFSEATTGPCFRGLDWERFKET